MNLKLVVEGNRKVEISELIQWRTYAGVIEGIPGPELNTLIMEKAIKNAKREFNFDAVVLIQPKETPIEGWLFQEDAPVKLPVITCIAKLKDHAHYADGDYGCLGIVWFQDDFAFPIDEAVQKELIKIQFSRLAVTFDFF